MLSRSYRWGVWVAVLAVGVVDAHEPPVGRSGEMKGAAHEPPVKRPGLMVRGPRPELLIKELALAEDQKVAVHRIFDEHWSKVRRVRDSFRQSSETREQLAKLREALLAAQQAGDDARKQEVRERMREIQLKRRERVAPLRKKLEAAQHELFDDLSGVMRGEQKARLETLWEEWTVPQKFGGRLRSPRALKAVVEKLPGLTPEQGQRIDGFFELYKQAVRETEKGTPKHEKLTKRLYDDVVSVLTPEQKTAVEKSLLGRDGRRDAPRGREGDRQSQGDQGRADRPKGDAKPPEE